MERTDVVFAIGEMLLRERGKASKKSSKIVEVPGKVWQESVDEWESLI